MLTRLTKRELIAQLDRIRWMAGAPGKVISGTDVRIARSYGAQDEVCEVQTLGDTAFICPVPSGDQPLVALMAKVFGKRMEPIDLATLRRELECSVASQVAIGWPVAKATPRTSAVVRCIAVHKEGVLTTYLFPGPMDIDRVNEEIKDYCAAHGCSVLKDGGDCELCEKMMECRILKDAEQEVKRRRGVPS